MAKVMMATLLRVHSECPFFYFYAIKPFFAEISGFYTKDRPLFKS